MNMTRALAHSSSETLGSSNIVSFFCLACGGHDIIVLRTKEIRADLYASASGVRSRLVRPASDVGRAAAIVDVDGFAMSHS